MPLRESYEFKPNYELMRTKTMMLRDEVKRTGATRYNSRRLIEMYSVASVLKAAHANPIKITPTYNINGEPAVPKGKFVQEHAESMA